MSGAEVKPDLCTVKAEGGTVRIDFVVLGKHSWLTFSSQDLDGLKQVVDAAIAQRDAKR